MDRRDDKIPGRAPRARTIRATRPGLLALGLLALGLVPGAAVPDAHGQLLEPPDVVRVTTHVRTTTAPPGEMVRAVVALSIDAGWHVNANQPFEEFLIPTEIALDPDQPVSVGRIIYPEPEVRVLAFSDTEMALYEGEATIGIEFQLPPDLEPGRLQLAGTLTYQACDDEKCLPPVDVPFELALAVGEARGPISEHPVFERVDWEATAAARTRFGTGGAAGGLSDPSRGLFDPSRGLLFIFVFAFVSGLALNLTPCVYPMIPITISIFGSQGGGVRRSLLLATFYVLGMALTYSTLGTFAALSGSMLGSALQNPLVLLFVAGVMVALALSMFGLFDLTMPQSLSRVAGESRQGVLGSLLMGLTVGIIAAPCIGPFVLALLTYVGSTGSPVLGFSIFFVLAMGLGLPFLVLATVSGSVASLPRSGAWMIWVKRLFGFVLLAMALYFLTRSQRLIPERFLLPALAFLSLVAGVYLGWIDRCTSPGGGFIRVKRAAGVLGVLASIALVVAPRLMPAREGIDWAPYHESALEAAAADGRPVIVDFSAAWCIPCKELDHYTFATPTVVARADAFVTLKADLTESRSPAVKALKERFGVLGVPTVVFLGPDGSEMLDLRFTGVIRPEEFLARMEDALARLDRGGA